MRFLKWQERKTVLNPKVSKKIVLAVLLTLFFDALVAVFGFSFLHENLSFFADKSEACILSDLLFLEGAIVFTVGAFVASGASIFRIESKSSLYASPEGHVKYLRESRKKQFNFGIVLMVIGAILIGSAIAIGAFLI